MKKRSFRVAAAFLGLAIALSGCGGTGAADQGAAQSQGAPRSDIILAQAGEPPALDPHNCYDSLAMRIYMHMFEGLLKSDEDGKLHPQLAESYEISDDGLTYTFHLRKDVKFQNGDPFTANDVKFSFDRACASSFCAEAAAPIDSTKVVDDYTVDVILKYPYEAQLPFFATTYLSIINEKVVSEKGADFSIDPGLSGTGPYQFVKWDKGSAVSMTANDNYYGEKPAIKDVTYKIITEASAGDIAVESGDVDVYLHPSTVDIPSLKDGGKVAVYEKDSYYVEYLGFNMQKAPFDKKEVREAVSLCFDKESIVTVAVDNIGGTVAGSFVGPLEFGYDESLKPYEKNIDKAKDLMKQAGYEAGFDCTITTVDGPRKKAAEALQSSLKEIGINASIDILESGAFFDTAMKGDVEMFITGMTTLAADADPMLYTCFSTDTIGVTNFSNYSNSELDKLIMDSRADRDADSRKGKLQQIQKMIYEDIPAIPLYFRKTINIANKDLKGLVVEPNNFLDVTNLSW